MVQEDQVNTESLVEELRQQIEKYRAITAERASRIAELEAKLATRDDYGLIERDESHASEISDLRRRLAAVRHDFERLRQRRSVQLALWVAALARPVYRYLRVIQRVLSRWNREDQSDGNQSHGRQTSIRRSDLPLGAITRERKPEKIIAHIGTYKTGTTAIQLSLARHSSSLLERQSILYPRSGRGRSPGHPHLAWEATRDARRDPGAGGTDELINEISESNPRVVLLSSEEFLENSELTSAWADGLVKSVEASLMAIAYVRPQWEFLESAYAQQVRSGSVIVSFDEFFARERDRRWLDYFQILRPWSEKSDGVIVRPYSEKYWPGSDVVSDFWNSVHALSSSGHHNGSRANIRTGARTTEMLRALSEELVDFDIDVATRRRLFAGARRFLESSLDDDDPPFRALTRRHIESLHDQYLESNNNLVREFLPYAGEMFEVPSETDDPNTWSFSDATQVERDVFLEVKRRTIQSLRLR